MANTFKSDVFRSGNLIGTFSIILFIGLFVLAVLGVFASGLMIISPDTNFELSGGETMNAGLFLVGIVALLQFGLRILSVVFFLVWLYRVFSNLSAIGGRNLEYSPGWAVGWWFVPFANLVQPYQVVKELYRESQKAALGESAVPTTETIGLWWGILLGSGFVLRFSDLMAGSSSQNPSQYFPVAYLAGQILFAVAAVFVIVIIKNVNTWQNQAIKTAVRSESYLPPPPPTFDHPE